jgi:hypothetical protein
MFLQSALKTFGDEFANHHVHLQVHHQVDVQMPVRRSA